MNEIIYKVDTIKRKVIVFVKREELAERHAERKRARQMEHLCRFGGLHLELLQNKKEG